MWFENSVACYRHFTNFYGFLIYTTEVVQRVIPKRNKNNYPLMWVIIDGCIQEKMLLAPQTACRKIWNQDKTGKKLSNSKWCNFLEFPQVCGTIGWNSSKNAKERKCDSLVYNIHSEGQLQLFLLSPFLYSPMHVFFFYCFFSLFFSGIFDLYNSRGIFENSCETSIVRIYRQESPR